MQDAFLTETAELADVVLPAGIWGEKTGTLIGGILNGHVFLPIHYGYRDENENGHKRAANELTLTTWDPVSKQPHFKFAAVQVHKVGDAPITEKLSDVAGKALDKASELTDMVMSSAHVERRRVADYVGRLIKSNEEFVEACESLASHHPEEAEIQQGMTKLSRFSDEAIRQLEPFTGKYGEREADEPDELRKTLFPKPRAGSFGLLRDLHALYVMASEVHVALTIVMQASKELRDEELLSVCMNLDEQNKRQQAWLVTQIEHRASHTLVVPQ